MAWHDFPLFWKAMTRAQGMRGSDDECAEKLIQTIKASVNNTTISMNTVGQVYAERRWMQSRRPYYDVYPSIPPAFIKVDLAKVKPSHIRLPIPDILLRFQVGKEFKASAKTSFRSILVSQSTSYRNPNDMGIMLACCDGLVEKTPRGDIPVHTLRAIELSDDVTVEEHLERGRQNPESEIIDDEAVTNALRLVVALCLIKDDPTLIEQEPLDADRVKWEATHDLALIEKAAKRGKISWSIGKRMEIVPGFRNAHFAIRWCGPGGEDPRLRPIKSSIVKRKKVETLPTGQLDT